MGSMNDEVSVKLTDEELLERGATLAAKHLHIDHLRDKKRADAKSTQALIDAELDEAGHLAREIDAQEALRKQGDLFVGDTRARAALAKVGEAACMCESDDVAKVDCPVHGTISRETKPGNGETNGSAHETADAEPEGLAEEPGDDPAGDVAPFPPAGGEAA